MKPWQFIVAGRLVLVSVCPLRREDGSLRFHVEWRPSKPDRLTLADMAEFDRQKALAIAALIEDMEHI